MKNPDSNSIEYEATPVANDTQEIFSGGLNIAMALQKLRARLLDLVSGAQFPHKSGVDILTRVRNRCFGFAC